MFFHHPTNSLCNPATTSAHMPMFIYPFLNTTCKARPFEYLRVSSLGVIGALVKTDDADVVAFLLTTEIIPLSLRIMEVGSELSKTVATFIVQKILLDDNGLQHVCQTYERFSHVALILVRRVRVLLFCGCFDAGTLSQGKLVGVLAKAPSLRLLKHVVRCYLRLADNLRAREALRQCLPEPLRDATFAAVLKDDQGTRRWLGQLLASLGEGAAQAGGL
jgi:CCR4-NOT transcription complex subunit 9